MPRTAKGLTRLELDLMQVIWKQGASSVSDVQHALDRELAYTTVQTVMNTLLRKGKLKRRLEGRAYVYSAAVTETSAARHAVRDLVERMFGGSSEELVMNLIRNRDIDPQRLAELTRRLDREEKK